MTERRAVVAQSAAVAAAVAKIGIVQEAFAVVGVAVAIAVMWCCVVAVVAAIAGVGASIILNSRFTSRLRHA